MSGRKLLAYINDTPVGELSESSGIWQFRYSAEWLAHPRRYPLSPTLPLTDQPLLDQATRRPVQWYFDKALLHK